MHVNIDKECLIQKFGEEGRGWIGATERQIMEDEVLCFYGEV